MRGPTTSSEQGPPAWLGESLSHPSAAAVEAVSGLDGDLLVLGAGGKMGPSLARMARRALDRSGSRSAVIAASRFTRPERRAEIEEAGARALRCDLLDREAVAALPDAAAVIFMVGTKFGTRGDESATWAINACLPGVVAERYAGRPTVVFSSGNVYPLVSVDGGGATEDTPPAPIGEYAQSVLARERVFEHFSRRAGTPTTILRLNYAAELRYGVPLDIARKVREERPIDLAMGHFNAIWQGDANAIALACLGIAESPPRILNVTGPERVSVRALAARFGEEFGKTPVLAGGEAETALLSDASRAMALFGPPNVSLDELIDWIAEWLERGGTTFDAPTHYQTRDGAY